ncbi:hypothetical protein BATDEDRAFT_27110 [Batrachochytrium dendrobatidis JAM81]|uniref:RRM domain-containing protein n=1 Tax=Batrachochytrium dendrobatidis (strain JAM81 / FGSC 10211) TaxID=684364 RepID=F4PA35_BATDJ|nr:uncharacterized protein BATDEDRAFT_27110 [Batrachochytrium dendrobatidis JAM81]EGF77833.1 hypothetical protein BATDEDRAFT_27110 [Batrachochytrium dendrobatidis JAM81]|eukprot:XP_006681380.1 hypothetical protein BATDEDRAFT_27110 [Batrachochytrium dendrobatidis JAM81]
MTTRKKLPAIESLKTSPYNNTALWDALAEDTRCLTLDHHGPSHHLYSSPKLVDVYCPSEQDRSITVTQQSSLTCDIQSTLLPSKKIDTKARSHSVSHKFGVFKTVPSQFEAAVTESIPTSIHNCRYIEQHAPSQNSKLPLSFGSRQMSNALVIPFKPLGHGDSQFTVQSWETSACTNKHTTITTVTTTQDIAFQSNTAEARKMLASEGHLDPSFTARENDSLGKNYFVTPIGQATYGGGGYVSPQLMAGKTVHPFHMPANSNHLKVHARDRSEEICKTLQVLDIDPVSDTRNIATVECLQSLNDKHTSSQKDKTLTQPSKYSQQAPTPAMQLDPCMSHSRQAPHREFHLQSDCQEYNHLPDGSFNSNPTPYHESLSSLFIPLVTNSAPFHTQSLPMMTTVIQTPSHHSSNTLPTPVQAFVATVTDPIAAYATTVSPAVAQPSTGPIVTSDLPHVENGYSTVKYALHSHDYAPTRNLLLVGFGIGIPLLELFQKLQVHGDIRHVLRPEMHPTITLVMYKSLKNAIRFFDVVLSNDILSLDNVQFVNAGQIAQLLAPSAHPEVWPMLLNQGRLHISGMATAWYDLPTLRSFFAAFGPVLYITEQPFHKNNPSFSCFVEFDNVDDAATAVRNLGCTNLHGSDIVAKFTRSFEEEKHLAKWCMPISTTVNSALYPSPLNLSSGFQVSNHTTAPQNSCFDYSETEIVGKTKNTVRFEHGQDVQILPQASKISEASKSTRYGSNQSVPSLDYDRTFSSPIRFSPTFDGTTMEFKIDSREGSPTFTKVHESHVKTNIPISTSETKTKSKGIMIFSSQKASNSEKTLDDLKELSCAILQRIPSECISSLFVQNIAIGKETRRTIMVKNIPNKFTQEMFIDLLNESHLGCFDFVYLRIDFKNKCNVGYAFVNFINADAVIRFADRFVGRMWGKFKSEKICGMGFATIQGKHALVEKFRNSSVMLEKDEFRPKIFYTDGPKCGKVAPFPGPTTTGFRPKVDVLFSRGGAWKQNKGSC